MENPVCALVEKQFVTTFPGALEFQLTVGGGVAAIYQALGGLTGQCKAGEMGHLASSCPLDQQPPRQPLCAQACVTGEIPPSRHGCLGEVGRSCPSYSLVSTLPMGQQRGPGLRRR